MTITEVNEATVADALALSSEIYRKCETLAMMERLFANGTDDTRTVDTSFEFLCGDSSQYGWYIKCTINENNGTTSIDRLFSLNDICGILNSK